MHESYHDIRSRISQEPVWFDEHAVPRYEPFSPKSLANIYAQEAALVTITCQSCRHAFKVAFSMDRMELSESRFSIADAIRNKTLEYGDPPNIECCMGGPTMISEPRRVLEYWLCSDLLSGWVRDSSLERDIEPDWVRAAVI